MTKTLFAAAILAIFAATPALADKPLKCNTAGMKKVEMMTKEAMKNKATMKASEMAMKESEMAMKAKEAGNKDECAMHLNMAKKELMKKG